MDNSPRFWALFGTAYEFVIIAAYQSQRIIAVRERLFRDWLATDKRSI
jgi:hypothetical protein